jgi:hypothetical protein
MKKSFFSTLCIVARFFCFFFLPDLQAMLIGNPAQPSLLTQGIVISPPASCSLRIGYLDDYVYRQRYKEFRVINETSSSKSFVKIYTHSALATFNFRNRLDLYGLLGSSRMVLDREIFTRSQFAWGLGGKLVIFQQDNVSIGTDIKYFQCDYSYINYLVSDGTPYNVVGPFTLKYNETQLALGICYKMHWIAPYINATYLISEIEPDPGIILIQLSPSDLVDSPIASITTQRRWGLAVGATLISCAKAALSVESRMINQNAIDINLEIRF